MCKVISPKSVKRTFPGKNARHDQILSDRFDEVWTEIRFVCETFCLFVETIRQISAKFFVFEMIVAKLFSRKTSSISDLINDQPKKM